MFGTYFRQSEALVAVVTAVLIAANCHAEWRDWGAPEGGGMLQIRTHGPGHAFRYAPTPRTPLILKPGAVRLLSQFAVSSIYVDDGDGNNYTMDFHLMDVGGGFVVGLPRDFSCELMFRERRPINAHMDQFIMEFHDLFGIKQNGRESVTKNDFRISVPPHDVELNDAYEEPFRRTIELTLQKTILSETRHRPALALGATAALLTYDGFYSDAGDVEGSAHFGGTKRFGRHHVNLSVAYSVYASRDPFPIPFRDEVLTGAVGWEWAPWDDHAFLLEYMISDGPVADLGQMTQAAHELRLGYRLHVEPAAIELGLVENFIRYDNSPDVVFHIALAYNL